jgi:purine-binding chemotaxis protein CheW
MDIAKIRKKLKGAEPADTQKSEVIGEGKIGGESPDVRTQDYKFQTPDQKLKKVDTEIQEENDIIEILTFSLLKEEFALRVYQLEEILRPQRITMVPKMPDYVMGITSLRGKIIPVIDLKTKLSLIDKPSDINPRGKILIIKGPKGPIGAEIDKVIGVVSIAKSEIIPPPSHLTEAEHKFIEGVTVVDKRFISIIQTEEAIKIELS